MVVVGDRCRFMPHFFNDGQGLTKAQQLERTVVAEVVYVNYKKQTFTAEYDCGPTKQRETFNFVDIDRKVTILGGV